MYLSLNWLKEFVPFKQTPREVADILTQGGFEVEKIEQRGLGLENVVVGQIKTIIGHAEADRLSVCKVDIGKKQPLKIVCGARNIKPGQRVPVALLGARLPNGTVIERRRIRGVESEGMLCAEDELGMGTSHSGIMILDKDLRLGQNFGKALLLDDIVLDISVTANRPDCMSVIGLAREFSALSNQKFNPIKNKIVESKKYSTNKLLSVRVADNGEVCPKYTARVVKNIKVKQSPAWLQGRLRVVGFQPVNNIVDITNYVMVETGQPLHAFDLANVYNKKIIVRTAKIGEQFITLDGAIRVLTPDMLMIADLKKSIAIAGIMGGVNSEISRVTKDVVIESAIFKSLAIRKARQKLGLVTEASMRFEKGIWWNLPEQAADRAAQLMSEMAGGEMAKGAITVSQTKSQKIFSLAVSLKYINKLIGRNFAMAEVKNILERLSFKVDLSGKDTLKVMAPAWRQDISLPADVAEEIGRVYGWNNIKPKALYAELKPVALPAEKYWERKAKDTLAACGMAEVLNYSFYGKNLLEQFGYQAKGHLRVDNPLNPEQEYLRVSLLPLLYENLRKNYQSRESVKIFEVGRVFIKTNKEMPDERVRLAGLVYIKEKRQESSQEVKNILQTLIQQFGIDSGAIRFMEKKNGLIQFSILIGQESIGYGGIIPFNVQKFGSAPAWFEIDMDKLIQRAVIRKQYKPFSDFPSVERDMTFTTTQQTGSNVDYHLIVNTVRQFSPLIEQVIAIVNIHTEPDGQKSISFRIKYQDKSKTLTTQEADSIEKKIIQTMQTMPFNFILKSHKLA